MTKLFFEKFHKRKNSEFYGAFVDFQGIRFTKGFWREWGKVLDKVHIFVDHRKKSFTLKMTPVGLDVLSSGKIAAARLGIVWGRYECMVEEDGEFVFQLIAE